MIKKFKSKKLKLNKKTLRYVTTETFSSGHGTCWDQGCGLTARTDCTCPADCIQNFTPMVG